MKPILFDFPMPITTPRLLLRPPQVGDGAIVNAAVIESMDNLSKFMPWAQVTPTVADTEEFIRQSAANWILKYNNEPYLPLLIFDKETKEFMGTAGYPNYDWEVPCIGIGYWLRNSCLGKGYITEAANALTQYAFKQLNMKRVSITCDIENIRSKNVMERLGYTLEATLKSDRLSLITGEVTSTLLYARYDLSGLPDLKVDWSL